MSSVSRAIKHTGVDTPIVEKRVFFSTAGEEKVFQDSPLLQHIPCSLTTKHKQLECW